MLTDNAPCHSRLENFFEEDNREHKLLRLGPYSPMHNAIEKAWSCLKAGTKKSLFDEMASILNKRNRRQLKQGEYRLQRLEAILQSNMNLITPVKYRTFIVHVQHFIAPAIAKEDVYIIMLYLVIIKFFFHLVNDSFVYKKIKNY